MKSKTIYINIRGTQGVETIDEFTQEAGQSSKDFYEYVRGITDEYHIAKMPVYGSPRCTKDWKNK